MTSDGGAVGADLTGKASVADVGSPLRHPVYRRLWLWGLVANCGGPIQAVAASWMMVRLAAPPDMVAAVQSAITLPFMLFAIPAGALADMWDRRMLMILGQGIMTLAAAALALLTWLHLATPTVLLGFCFAAGCGTTLYLPAMQASVPDQVPLPVVPGAMAFNSMSANLGRSLGPAIGGFIIAVAGVAAGFITNALACAGLVITLLLWKPVLPRHPAPSGGLAGAVLAGLRFIIRAPPILVVLLRSALFSLLGSTIWALLPLVARDFVGGGSITYGLLLGALGTGALLGALVTAPVRQRLDPERIVRIGAAAFGIATMVVAASRWTPLTMLVLVLAGWGWTLSMVTFNVSVQLAAPRWIAGRALAAFQGGVYGAMALGGWGFGHAVVGMGLTGVLLISGVAMLLSPIAGLRLRLTT